MPTPDAVHSMHRPMNRCECQEDAPPPPGNAPETVIECSSITRGPKIVCQVANADIFNCEIHDRAGESRSWSWARLVTVQLLRLCQEGAHTLSHVIQVKMLASPISRCLPEP